MQLPPFLAKLFTGGAGKLIESITNTVDEFVLSKEEQARLNIELAKVVNDHSEKMAAFASEEMKAEFADMANARDREIQVSASEKTPLINKIITPILALIIVLSTFIIWSLILFRNYEPKINEAMIIGALTTMTAGIISYYFGSSAGSQRKEQHKEFMERKG